ncbi:MAG: hypothetical protein GY898_17220 [Proteobacteria bacterium]|nr:hypothetical protein [Pseudomonadota bacterium]
MPIYEYVCDSCSETVEVLQKRNAPAPECPTGDEGQMVRVLSAHNVGAPSRGGGAPAPKEACGDCPSRRACGVDG